MALVQKTRHWLSSGSRPRRAGVSAFGIGGTNAHVVVEEPPKKAEPKLSHLAPGPEVVPLLLSAHTDSALRAQVDKLRAYLSNGRASTVNLGDVAYSLATSRNHFPRRMVVTARTTAELLDQVANSRTAIISPNGPIREPRLAMVFPGQGSQLSGMGKALAKAYSVFREALEEITSHFNGALEEPLLDIMWADASSPSSALLHRTDYAQPALFTFGVALWRLWQSWGVQAEFVLGHSVGELTAAHVAGVINLSDACRLVAARSRLMQAQSSHGGMASLRASAIDVRMAIETLNLGTMIDIVAYNTHSQTVASGDMEALEALMAYFVSRGCQARRLDVSHAFHSHHMDGMLAAFQAVAETVQFNIPEITIVSTHTGKRVEPSELKQPSYWVQQARSPVRYSDGIQSLADYGVNVFLELGPQAILCGMGATCFADDSRESTWLPSLRPGRDEIVAIQQSLAELHVRHTPINWAAYFQPYGCLRVELPTYAFQRERLRAVPDEQGIASNTINGTADHAKSIHAKDFQVNWCRTATESLVPGGAWGLLCPVGAVKWEQEVTESLVRGGIQLLRVDSLQNAEKLDGILCLWDSDADVIPQSYNFTVTALEQLQTAAHMGFARPLVWITSHAVGTGIDDGPAGVGAGPLWGLMRTARNERPDLPLRLIDLGRGAGGMIETHCLPQVLMLSNEPECALRQGQVLVPRMQRVDPPGKQTNQQSLVRQDGAVLITGGLGNLGSNAACWLASKHGIRDLVLTSRRGMETPGAGALVDRLAKLGAKATVVSGDMADPDSVKSILESFSTSRPLRGIIHTAGMPDVGVIATLTPQKCASTFGPKVYGDWHLHNFTKDIKGLDLFVVISSISGVMGMSGLGFYAAAKVFLDALVDARKSQGLPGISVAYGPLGGGGMAEGMTNTTRTHLSQFGLELLTPDESLGLLELATHSGRGLSGGGTGLETSPNIHQGEWGYPCVLSLAAKPPGYSI